MAASGRLTFSREYIPPVVLAPARSMRADAPSPQFETTTPFTAGRGWPILGFQTFDFGPTHGTGFR
jgi:hypothetical protein